jgi:hypothetical protein
VNRYRQTMIIELDVLASDEAEATEIAGEIYFDFDHFWSPDRSVIVPEGDSFFPVNY